MSPARHPGAWEITVSTSALPRVAPARHLPTYERTLAHASAAVHVTTSAFRCADRGVWLRIGPQLHDMTPAEALAMGRALIEAAEHRAAAQQVAA